MSKKSLKSSTLTPTTTEVVVVNPNAAGIGIDSKFHAAAVGQGLDELIRVSITTPACTNSPKNFNTTEFRPL